MNILPCDTLVSDAMTITSEKLGVSVSHVRYQTTIA
jgi:hypothetical protein